MPSPISFQERALNTGEYYTKTVELTDHLSVFSRKEKQHRFHEGINILCSGFDTFLHCTDKMNIRV